MCARKHAVAYDVNLGSSDAGADGAAVVFHDDARGVNAIGAPGSDLGISGIANGLAIEFDTFGEIASDHTNFRAATGGFATPRVALAGMEDGAWHPVVVELERGNADYELRLRWPGPLGTLTGGTSLPSSWVARTSPMSASAPPPQIERLPKRSQRLHHLRHLRRPDARQ